MLTDHLNEILNDDVNRLDLGAFLCILVALADGDRAVSHLILAHAEEEIVLRHLGFAYGLVDRQIPCLHVTVETDGLQTVGDLGGVLGAYDGLMINFAENGRPENIDGFTPEQRFFMSWATVWRTLSRDDALRNQVKTDPHSPGRTRATQPLVNIDAFYEAFDIKEGDGMWLAPEERVRIW